MPQSRFHLPTSSSILYLDQHSAISPDNLTTNANLSKIVAVDSVGRLELVAPNSANGYLKLDSSGKIASSLLPAEVMEFKGMYNITTNTPALVDYGTHSSGDIYQCSTAGSRFFAFSGTITVSIGDWMIYNGTNWEKSSHVAYNKVDADARFLNLAGGTLTGGIVGTTAGFSGLVIAGGGVQASGNITTTGTITSAGLNTNGNAITVGGITCGSISTGGNPVVCGATGDVSCRHLSTAGNYYASGGIELGWGLDKTGNPLQSMIFHKTWSAGTDIVGSSADGTNRLVVLWDNIHTSSVSCSSVNTNNGNITMGTGDLSCDSITCNSINGQLIKSYSTTWTGTGASTTESITLDTGYVATIAQVSAGGETTTTLVSGIGTITASTTQHWTNAVVYNLRVIGVKV